MIGTTNVTGERIDGRETRHDETVEQRRRLGTVKAGAEILAVGEKTVRRMIDAGKLPGVCRLGRLVRLDLDILDNWIAQGCPPLHRFNAKGAR